MASLSVNCVTLFHFFLFVTVAQQGGVLENVTLLLVHALYTRNSTEQNDVGKLPLQPSSIPLCVYTICSIHPVDIGHLCCFPFLRTVTRVTGNMFKYQKSGMLRLQAYDKFFGIHQVKNWSQVVNLLWIFRILYLFPF